MSRKDDPAFAGMKVSEMPGGKAVKIECRACGRRRGRRMPRLEWVPTLKAAHDWAVAHRVEFPDHDANVAGYLEQEARTREFVARVFGGGKG